MQQQRPASMYQIYNERGEKLQAVTLEALQEMAMVGVIFSDSMLFDLGQNRMVRADAIAELAPMLRPNPSRFGEPTPPAHTQPVYSPPASQATTYCSGCGKLSTGIVCTGCGQSLRAPQQQQQYRPQEYQPVAPQQQQPLQQQQHPTAQRAGTITKPAGYSATGAIVGSVFITGLGQMLNGQTTKGVVMLLAAIFIGIPTGGLAALALSIIGIIDAVAIGKRLERGESVGEWQFF